ncbi:MAG: hypothetical protein LH647_13195 [Leptolyngbyaceae cyanobacterium CAN_BIN12]|nr:hypothetical protein [Leptolyngbyaceae cyanobacterium CAN_BIN12]
MSYPKVWTNFLIDLNGKSVIRLVTIANSYSPPETRSPLFLSDRPCMASTRDRITRATITLALDWCVPMKGLVWWWWLVDGTHPTRLAIALR